MLLRKGLHVLGALARLGSRAHAINLDVNSEQSIIEANSIAVDNAMAFYIGDQPGQIPGLLVQPYYWWECGALFGLLIQRWALTKNDTLNGIITTGLQNQIGENDNYEPRNQTKDLGNDDQLFWAYAVMDAAELGFPNPPANEPSWLALAQAVFNRQTTRWDTANCGGGMRWQTVSTNPGWDYKNVASNGGYFQLAARLAHYTGNSTYERFANRAWDWMESSAIFGNSTSGLTVWDGIHIENCSGADPAQFTYNQGTLLMGAAYLYDYTNGSTKALWATRISMLLQSTDRFFYKTAGPNTANNPPPGPGLIMAEPATEFAKVAPAKPNNDAPSFKAYFSRWLAMTAVLAPFTNDTIHPRLVASAQAAAQQCTGTAASQHPGTSCGRRWYQSVWDGNSGVGEQMSAFSAFQSLLVKANATAPPLTAGTGGKSKGSPGAGNGVAAFEDSDYGPISTGDRFGAAVLTVLALGLAVGGGLWMAF